MRNHNVVQAETDATLMTQLLPHPIAIAATDVKEPSEDCLKGQETILCRNFSPTRLRTFAAGRVSSRLALSYLGIEPCPIGMKSKGEPVWPPNITGSISHTNDLAIAAVANKKHFVSLGIDVERCGALTQNLEAQVRSEEDPLICDPTLLFSIKESAYKCVSDQCSKIPDFTEAAVDLDYNTSQFSVRPIVTSKGIFPTTIGIYRQTAHHWLCLSYILKESRNRSLFT